MRRYFHPTTQRAASAIIKNGFKDAVGYYMTTAPTTLPEIQTLTLKAQSLTVILTAFIVLASSVAAGCAPSTQDSVLVKRELDKARVKAEQKRLEAQTPEERIAEEGRRLFNHKAMCAVCHGVDGDITKPRADVDSLAKLYPRPTDLRAPSEKSARQLALIIRYGIPGTGMVFNPSVVLRPEEVQYLIAYLFALQGKSRLQDEAPIGDVELAIGLKCQAEAIGDPYVKASCEERLSRRWMDLLTGRPSSITPSRYEEIKTSCQQRFGTMMFPEVRTLTEKATTGKKRRFPCGRRKRCQTSFSVGKVSHEHGSATACRCW